MRFPLPRPVAAALIAAITLCAARPGAAQAAPPSPAPATSESQFTILIFERTTQLIQRTGPGQDAYWSAYDDFAAALMRGGVLRGGSALSETEAATVRGKGSVDATVSGARLGGYFVIAARDLAEAQRWARLAPPQATMVEVRPHRENPHMAKVPPR